LDTTAGLESGEQAISYTLSASGDRKTVTENGKTTVYAYDGLHRLVSEEITISSQAMKDSVLNEVRR
jgi:YD repeat-containing protein